MKFRKLRIAWSIVWGVVAVLLCALWVRSYWNADFITYYGSPVVTDLFLSSGYIGIGQIDAKDTINPAAIGTWKHKTPPVSQEMEAGWIWVGRDFAIVAPGWLVVSGFAIAAVAPWIYWRFSLRTLLIATTLVAVTMGLIAWLKAQ